MSQTPFQQRAWQVAREAHSVADRGDARILMAMVRAVDERDYAALAQLAQALRPGYRARLGAIPDSAAADGDGQRGDRGGDAGA